MQNGKVQTKMQKKRYIPTKEDNIAMLLLLIFAIATRVLLAFIPYIPGFNFIDYFLDILIALSLLWFLVYFWRQYNEKRRHTNNN